MEKTKSRKNGQGNVFSEVHRKLGKTLSLTDLDFIQGKISLGALDINVSADTEDNIFAEYSLSMSRAMTTAIFDYKYNLSNYIKEELAEIKIGKSIWYYSQLARQLGARSFVVCANNGEMPLMFIETTKGKAEVIGVLKGDEPETVQSFWKNILKLS